MGNAVSWSDFYLLSQQQWATTKLKGHLISTIHIKVFQSGEKYWPISNEPLVTDNYFYLSQA